MNNIALSDTLKPGEEPVIKLFVHKCHLCDIIFIKEFNEDYHTIVSGYDTKTGKYWETGKYQSNHILKCQRIITLTEQDLEDELDNIVSKVVNIIKEESNYSKLDAEIEFCSRKIILNYFAVKSGEVS